MVSIDTAAVHAGQTPDAETGALTPPIHQTTTYAHAAPQDNKGYSYGRTGNPTVDVLGAKLAALEGGSDAVCYGSGMAAIDATFRLLEPGSHAVVSEVVYGGTVRLLENYYEKHRLEVSYVDTTRPERVRDAIRPDTELLFVETPANPTLDVSPLGALGAIADEHGILYAVDNTFHTPALQRPINQGADLVVHSTTKYLEGHGTTIGGAVVVDDRPDVAEALDYTANACGTRQNPFEAWLTLRGIQTLPLRIEKASETAERLAEHLDDHPRVADVAYPGLESFPGHALNAQQADGGGAVLSFVLDGGRDDGVAFVQALDRITLAENLGQAETLISHPATMTHKDLPRDRRLELGIPDGMLRISVGYEDPGDLIADLEQGFEAI